MLRQVWTHDVDRQPMAGGESRAFSVFPSLSAWLVALPLLAFGLWYLLSR